MKTVLHVLGFKIVCHFDLFVGNGADQISPFVIAGLARKRRSCRFPETKPSSSEKYLNSKGEIDEEEEKAGKRNYQNANDSHPLVIPIKKEDELPTSSSSSSVDVDGDDDVREKGRKTNQ